jgi:hypothetical protein
VRSGYFSGIDLVEKLFTKHNLSKILIIISTPDLIQHQKKYIKLEFYGKIMNELEQLHQEVFKARENYLQTVKKFSFSDGIYKPDDKTWSAAEITEHLVKAEHGGINGMWKALMGIRNGKPVWDKEHTNRGLTIEEVVRLTWKDKEKAPEIAEPTLGGPLEFWISALEACQVLVDRIVKELEGEDLENIVYPHPISGPLDIRQRFNFLRFHLDRHHEQVLRLRI